MEQSIMIKLKSDEFYIVQENIGFERLCPEPISVIMKNNPGDIYVDNIKKPKTALIWSYGIAGFYLIGDYGNKKTNNDIKKFVDSIIIKRMKEKDYNCFEVSGSTPSWDRAIAEIFGQKELRSWKQIIYIGDLKTQGESLETSFPYEIKNLKDESFDITELVNKDYLINELLQFWNDIDIVKKKGNCFYAIINGEVIGMCYTGFVTDEMKAIGIETVEKYRRNKVGYNLALNCLHEIVEEGKTPYWDCMDENVASKRLAEKLGLTKSGEYICHGFSI